MIYALIPAAGKSTRMGGRTKLALPLGNRSVLEHVIDAVRRGGVEHVLVVVGPHVPELVPLAQAVGAETLLLPRETPDMRATVEAGLRSLEGRFHPQPSDNWLLVPGDHPALDADIIQQLVQARRECTDRSIIIPSFQGKRGHPTLIDWKHASEIRRRPPDEGINTYLRGHAANTLEIPVDVQTILIDLDTPADYERLARNWEARRPVLGGDAL